MPHNLYLHSSLVQTRRINRNSTGIWTSIKYNFIDSAIALNAAFFVNAAILVLPHQPFFRLVCMKWKIFRMPINFSSNARNTLGIYSFWDCAGSGRAKFYYNGDASRPNRYGGISQFTDCSLAKATDYTTDCHYPCIHRDPGLWGIGNWCIADLKPGNTQFTIGICRHTAYSFYQ